MATTFERITDVIAGGMDKVLRALEDPSVSASRDVKRKELKAASAGLEAANLGSLAEGDIKDYNYAKDKAEHYRSLAKQAAADGNDEDARLFLQAALEWDDETAAAQEAMFNSLASTAEAAQVTDDLRAEIKAARKTARYTDTQIRKAAIYKNAAKVLGNVPSADTAETRRRGLEAAADYEYNRRRIYYGIVSPQKTPLAEAEARYVTAGRNAKVEEILASLKEDAEEE